MGGIQFYGETSFRPNANISKGSLCPVLLKNPENNSIYLYTMKFGIDIFDNNKQLTNNARSEDIEQNQAWKPLIDKGQRCVIICKGFYFWHNVAIYNAKYVKHEKEPYYVQPDKVTEGDFFYVAGLYHQKKTYRGVKHSFVAITQSAEYDNKYNVYVQRIPFFLRKRDISTYLDPKQSITNFLSHKQKINTLPFQKIGLWVNNTKNTKENIVLQSKEQWDMDQNAKSMGFDDGDFPFDLIEKEALKQNEAKKLGIKYKTKNNWDHLKESEHEIHPSQHHNEESDDNELKMEEEYTSNTNKKRQRDEDEYMDLEDMDIQQPPHKKQRVDSNLNEIEDGNQYTFSDHDSDGDLNQNSHQKPNRRHSIETKENHLKSMKNND